MGGRGEPRGFCRCAPATLHKANSKTYCTFNKEGERPSPYECIPVVPCLGHTALRAVLLLPTSHAPIGLTSVLLSCCQNPEPPH
jgi:hypothetical protein